MNLDSIKPKGSPRIIDLVSEVGIDTSEWAVNNDGTPCAEPASNPKYCYEWCFRDYKKKILLLNLWFDETSSADGVLSQNQNLRTLASSDVNANRRRRAMNMDSALRVASRGGWTIRVMMMDGKNESDAKQKASYRMLDPNPWSIRSYDEDTGDCFIVRENQDMPAPSSESRQWSMQELRASVEAYLEMRDLQVGGETFIKTLFYKSLAEQFDRTEKAFEFRMQNISHVLSQQGREWVKGLRPARNVGTNVTSDIESLIAEVEGTTANNAASFNAIVDELRRKSDLAPPVGNRTPNKKDCNATTYDRDPQVIAWVLRYANGLCESCGCESPFLKDDGSPFLEVHHVIRLADNGPDTIENAVALCPNCHRALHYAADKHERRDMLYAKVLRLNKIHPKQCQQIKSSLKNG